MPQVLQWPAEGGESQAGALPQACLAVVETCRRALLRGELAALPTEAGYVLAANALQPEAVARLAALRTGGPLPAIAVRGADDARDWVPELGSLSRRLTRRCWPGPVVLVYALGVKSGAATRLPDGVLRTIGPGWELGLTAPHHPAVRALLDDMAVPLVLGGLADEPRTFDAVLRAAENVAAVIVDGGSARFDRPPTVVEIRGEHWLIRREGAIPAADITRLTARLTLFICTGNTCRSPLAAALCRKRLADRLGCSAEDLPNRGHVIASAGLAAMHGEPAAAEAVTVAGELGADLSGHVSRPVTNESLADADLIVGMTAAHIQGLGGLVGADVRTRLLCGEADLPDPIGGDLTVYQACAGTIWQSLEGLVDELSQGTANEAGPSRGEVTSP